MYDLQNITENFEKQIPSFFHSDEEYKTIPEEHKDQIHVFTKEASLWLRQLVDDAELVNGRYTSAPLTNSHFKKVDIFNFPGFSSESALKKWLYNRGIPFSHSVYLIDYYEEHDYYITWKMLIKYADLIFYGSDKVIFDSGMNWCLVQFVVDTLHFGYK